jgi:hypothetical protein
MSERDDEQFDAMLSGFLKNSLDPQRGRSEWNFRRYLNDASRNAWKQRTWLIGAFFTGMAASVAMLWASPLFRTAAPTGGQVAVSSVDKTQTNSTNHQTIVPAVERVVQSHTTDQGIMLFGDDTPVRVLRRQRLEQTRWLNGQQQIESQQTVPQEELLFIKMPTY